MLNHLPIRLFFLISMIILFFSMIFGIIVALNRLISFRKTSKISRNVELIKGETEINLTSDEKIKLKKECGELRKKSEIFDKITWILLSLQLLFFMIGSSFLFCNS